ncbi:MAG: polysaccharide biosynthesis protein PslH [Thermoanaerobaculia bacterium]|jgi:glycosyltransferase involved in cell wall biosynthesis|nr:polysaccharide biosynthesis protein PslH [Thermoanaerobaculia bacterium]
MRILQLTPRLSFPPSDGGRVVMLQIATALQRAGAGVRILSLNPRKQHASVEAARQFLDPIPIDAVDIDTSAHLRAALRSFRIGAPQLVARFYSPHFAATLRSILQADDVDVVQIESPFLLPYVPAIREVSSGTVVLRSLNVEFRIWEQMAAREKHLPKRAMLRAVARALRRYELRQLDTCDALVTITDDDARDFRALGCTRPIYVLPGGVEAGLAHDSEEAGQRAGEEPLSIAPRSAGFLGSLDYRPNQEAALWIAETLHPRLDASIHIAGSNAPAWLRERLETSGVTFDGRIADAGAFIRSRDVMIAPLFSGGGMRIKILEAMAQGKPVVATTIGAAGIAVTHGENILLADHAETFAAAVSGLLHNRSRAASIGNAARQLVASRYSTDALARGLLAFYDELTKSRGVNSGR